MTSERQRVITPRRSRFLPDGDRSQLFYFLSNLGMRANVNSHPLVTPNQVKYTILTIKEDLGIPKEVPVWIKWFETGSVFSQARDAAGNQSFNVHIGSKENTFQVTFNKKQGRFQNLYFNDDLINFQKIAHLF